VTGTGPASRRVVSLVPSVTETLLGWGLTPVAVTRFCPAPGVLAVGGTKNPDIEAIIELDPDLVVMDREENRAADAQALESAGIAVLATHITSLTDVQPELTRLATALGLPAPEPGTLSSPAPHSSALRVWVPIWRRPWMAIGGGTYGSSLLRAAGFHNVCAGQGGRYPCIDPAEVAGVGADYVLAPSEPYKFTERHRVELEVVAPAVFVDGQDLFWWGARTEAALRRFGDLAMTLATR